MTEITTTTTATAPTAEFDVDREARAAAAAASLAGLDAFYSATVEVAGQRMTYKQVEEVYHQTAALLAGAPYPLMVPVVSHEHEEKAAALYCPRCAEIVEGVDEIDASERWNTGTLVSDDPNALYVSTADDDYQTFRYQCPQCHEGVRLPEGVESYWG